MRTVSESIYKPNSVPGDERQAAIIHLGPRLLAGSSDLPGNARRPKATTEADHFRTLPYLVLHRRGFA